MKFSGKMSFLTAVLVLAAGAGAYYDHLQRSELKVKLDKVSNVPPHVAAGAASAPPGMKMGAKMFGAADAPSRPAFTMNDLQGRAQEAKQWDGKTVLYNFWAAWCPPCRREIPVFNEVRDFYHEDGFEVIGIALDEQEAVEKFLKSLGGINYPQLIGLQKGMKVMHDYGNATGGLPYSVMVDKNKRIRYAKQGEIEKGELIAEIEKLLQSN